MELTKEMLDYMQSLRRRLKEELGVSLKLSQADAIPAMLVTSFDSHDAETLRQAQTLAALAGIDWKALEEQHQRELADQGGASVRIYRGQRVY